MSDIVERLRAASRHALMSAARSTVLEAADEVERLREAIRRLAEQDATLSVCDGAVTVTMDATLTGAEREAVEWAAKHLDNCGWSSATLRGLLERMGDTR